MAGGHFPFLFPVSITAVIGIASIIPLLLLSTTGWAPLYNRRLLAHKRIRMAIRKVLIYLEKRRRCGECVRVSGSVKFFPRSEIARRKTPAAPDAPEEVVFSNQSFCLIERAAHAPYLARYVQVLTSHSTFINLLLDGSTNPSLIAENKGTINVAVADVNGILHDFRGHCGCGLQKLM